MRQRRHGLRSITAGLLTLGLAASAHAGRFEDLTSRFANTPDQAKVIAAGYIGGPGTEWLCGGGIQPDGTIVLVGNAIGPGPDLVIAGKTASLLGTKDPEPAPAPEGTPVLDKEGKPKLNKDGSTRYKPFGWNHFQSTGFVMRLGSDLKSVKSLARFPWTLAGATSAAVDNQGHIYVVGVTINNPPKYTDDYERIDVGFIDANMRSYAVYLAKLSPEGDKLLWLRTMEGPTASPLVRIMPDGRILFQGPDLRIFNADGKTEQATKIPGGISARTVVNPRDGTVAYGGEHHWATGREPWRCPILNIHNPDGSLLHHLYDWGGPFVGLNRFRLVSDSAVRNLAYDTNGDLLISAWSDGGNSVMNYEPYDITKRSPNFAGLGMSAWGAGVLSVSYLLRIDTQSYSVKNGTLWLAYTSKGPNSITIDAMDFAGDRSVAIAGSSAFGLIQTGNNINTGDQPGGPYVAILNNSLSSLRFSSVINAGGMANVNSDGSWAFASSIYNGHHVLMVLTGAVAEDRSYNDGKPAPTVNAVQEKFAGGFCDGYMLMLDLGPAAPQNPAPAPGKRR